MTNHSLVKVILFDLGNVILPFDNHQIAGKLSRFSRLKKFQDPENIFSSLFDLEKGMINSFEEGKISPSGFFESVKRSFDLGISLAEFVPIWTDIFTENLEVSQIILSLKREYRLGLLSNTDPLHFPYILSKFPIVRLFERWILSYEVGFKKPAIEIFRKAIEWASVEPEKIIFIDDSDANIKAAVSVGIQGVHFISSDQLKEELKERLDFKTSLTVSTGG